MRFLYYHQHFSTPRGATGTRSYEMARRLIARGHQVTMVCGSSQSGATGLSSPFRKGKREGVVEGVRIIELELPYSNYDSLMQRSFTFLRFAVQSTLIAFREDYDLLFATSTPLTAGIPGILAGFFRRKPFVFEVRDLWPELPREMGVITNVFVLKAMAALEWLSYHAARSCIGLSPGIVKGIIRLGISPERVAMIPNGCDLEIFNPEKGDVLRPKGVLETDFLAVFCGAHGLANGLDRVLDAAAELKQRGRPDIKIAFIGDGKLKPALMDRARKEDLSNCLFMNPVPKLKLISYLRGANAGLMILANVPAFYYGTSPNKFFDYIAMGLPVLNNYPGWLAGMIVTHHCGVAVLPENPVAFADALEQMADNPVWAKQMGQNARRLAETSFARQSLSAAFVDWLEKSINLGDWLRLTPNIRRELPKSTGFSDAKGSF